MPDSNQSGYFHSDPSVKFSLDMFLTGLNNLSYGINGFKRPFDALFLGQCASSLKTLSKVIEKEASHFVIASPEIVPFKGLYDWNLKALKEHLDNSLDMEESLQIWLKNTFTPYTKENITDKIYVHYSLSLYNINFLKNLKVLFKETLKNLEKDESYLERKKERDNIYNLATSHYEEEKEKTNDYHFLVKGFPLFDCKHINSMETFLEKTSFGVTTYTSRGKNPLFEIARKQKQRKKNLIKKENNPHIKEQETNKEDVFLEERHSGWSCL